jgi:hypothetical protein
MSNEDQRLAADVAAAEEREAQLLAEKRRKQAEMRDNILAHTAAQKHRVMTEIMERQEQEAREQQLFEQRLKVMEAEEAAAAAAKRAEARRVQLLQRAQMADKRRNIETTRYLDRTALAAADSLAAGGPVDAAFHAETAKLVEQEEMIGHTTRPLKRMVHKMLNPPLISGGGRT